METNYLLEVFGGQDILRLMCGATRFHKESRNSMSFHVGTYKIRVKIKTRRGVAILYYLDIFEGGSGKTVGHAYTTCPDRVRDRFEHHTGYALSF
jgi:hypothetical protein